MTEININIPDSKASSGDVEFKLFELYWSPLITKAPGIFRIIEWLFSGLAAITRGLVTLPLRSIKEERSRSATKDADEGKSSFTPGDLGRLLNLTARLLPPVVLLPVLGLFACIVVLSWLVYWGVITAILIYSQYSNPSLNLFLVLLGVCALVLAVLAGEAILNHSVNTSYAYYDTTRTSILKRYKWLAMLFAILSFTIFISSSHYYLSLLQLALYRINAVYHNINIDSVVRSLPNLLVSHDTNIDGRASWIFAAIVSVFIRWCYMLYTFTRNISRDGCSMYRGIGVLCGQSIIVLTLFGMLHQLTQVEIPEFSVGLGICTLTILVVLALNWVAVARTGVQYIREYLGDLLCFINFEENNKYFAFRKSILQLTENHLEMLFDTGTGSNSAATSNHSPLHEWKSRPLKEGDHNGHNEEPYHVIILAHSLGSVIAFQSLPKYYSRLKEMQQLSEAQNGLIARYLNRLKLLITYGSPIDLLTMGFDARNSGRTILDRLTLSTRHRAGSVGAFQKVRWTNWWNSTDCASAQIIWQGAKGSIDNSKVRISAFPVLNHTYYLDLSKEAEQKFLAEFTKLMT